MTNKQIIATVIGVLFVGAIGWFLMSGSRSYSHITSYQECIAAGHPIIETYPEQCKVPDGRMFTHIIENDFSNLIHIAAPQAGDIITSPLIVSGEARGNWYFEASFPVKLVDVAGNVLVQSHAQAEGDWMTMDFVPFKATLMFNAPASGAGTLIVNNDNPSGLPEHDKEVRIPVRFGGSVPAFDTPLTLRVGDKTILPHGLSLELKEINDSRCKPNVQCIWAGELSFLFSVSSGGSSEELRLGTATKKSVTLMGHTFTLQSGTTEVATVVVALASSTGGVSGLIHVGPTCPVERMPPDLACADRPYVNAKVTIRSKASGTLAGQSVSDANGGFRVALPPGTYTVDVASPTNNILPRCGAVDATVNANEFTSVDVSCDSGIR